jgi:hypothetical protein
LPIANADSGYSKIIFSLLAFAWQLAYWRSIDANTQTFLLRTPTWIPSLIGLLVLHQQNLGDHFSSRNLYALMTWSLQASYRPSSFFPLQEPCWNTTPLKKNEGRTLESWGFELLEIPHNKGVTGPSSAVAA